MSRRLMVLCAVLVVGLAALAYMAVFTDSYAEVANLLPGRPKPDQRTATARPARPPTSRPRVEAVRDTTLLHELPRQAMLVAAAHDLGLPVADRSVDFGGATDELPLRVEVNYSFGKAGAKVTVRDGKGAAVRELDLPITALHANYLNYAKLAAAVEPWGEAHFAPLLAAAGQPTRAANADDALPVPEGVEALLAQVDPQRSFLAAHALHAAVAETGESPARLAALARAYAHLAESTRHLYSRHGSVFFARALLYAERLTRKYPDLPLSHAARGYAYTLFGQTPEGRRSIDKARELAAAKGVGLPGWLDLADDLSRFRTGSLFKRAKPDHADAALASYFALLTVEHSGLQSATINMARLAREYNPGALRTIDVMTDNSGVSLQHTSTEESRQAQFALLAQLAKEPAAPEAVKKASTDAARARFATDALGEVFAKMDAERGGPGQLLPWGAYASVSRDALFLAGFRRLYFIDRMLAADASATLRQWWPVLKDHRFAPVLAGFDRTGKLLGLEPAATKAARDALRQTSRDDFYQRMPWIDATAMKLRPPATPEEQRRWKEHYEYGEDDTAYELANLLWTYRGRDADAIQLLAASKAGVASQLLAISPNHPSAVAELIVNRWLETRERAAEIERELGGHPQVAYALARAYRSEKRYADAARLLEQVIALSPDRPAYAELAEVYEEQGDAEKWLAVYEKYLKESEDFGLDHAKANEKVAYTLMRMKQPDKALKYAKASANSYSSWGLRVYSECLTELGRYDEAEQVARANQERYPGSLAWYRWCQTTGKGDLKAARAMTEERVKELEADAGDGGPGHDVAIFHAMEGRPDRARDGFTRAYQRDPSAFYALELALLDLAEGKAEAAATRLEEAADAPRMPGLPPELAKMMGNVTPPTEEKREAVYRAAMEEFQRCLQNATTLPRRDGPVRVILDARGTAYRATAAYALGRLCELRGSKDDAEWWYRQSLDTGEWTSATRPQAAAGLRRLGVQYYK